MDYKSVKEYLYNDLTNVYRVTDYGEWTVRSLEGITIHPGEYYLFHPSLSYGDYLNSSEIERSNVRIFKKRFHDIGNWKIKNSDHDTVHLIIDILCDDQNIIDTLLSLDDYCSLDDQDAAALLIEMEEEAWQDYLLAEFSHTLEKHFKANHSDPDADPLWDFYCRLKQETNTEVTLNGGQIIVDFKRMVTDLTKAPDFLHLEFW